MTDYTVTQVDPGKLKPHPANSSLYGDSTVLDQLFVDSIKGGVLEPLLATGDMTIISGHRRREAALSVGLTTVPVVVRPDLTDPLDVEEALIVANKQRTKDNLQKAREFKRLQEIEAKRAASRRGRSKKITKEVNKNEGPKGRASDIAAKQVGMSPATARKAAEVVDEIDKAEAGGDLAKAKDLSEKLKSNVSGAHRDATTQHKVPKKLPTNLVKTFESQSKYRSLVAKIGSVRKEILDLSLEEGGERILIHNVRVEVKNLLEVLHAATPHAVCPYCGGGGCDECEQYGWMTKDSYSGIPKERR